MQAIDFKELFERLPSPHMVLDRNLDYIEVNSAYEKAVLRSRDELIGHNLFELFPNEGVSGQQLRSSFARVFKTGERDTLAFIPYDIPNPQEPGGFEQRYWTAVHTPLTNGEGQVDYLIQNTVDVTEMVRLREAASLPFRPRSGEMQLIERAREAEDAHRALLAESSEFRRMFQQAPGFIAVLAGPNHVFTFANDAYRRLIGGREVVGQAVATALPEVAGQGFSELLDEVYRTGRQHIGEGTRILLQRAPGEEPRESFLDFSYDAIRNHDGDITGVFVQGMDRTESVRTLRRQRLLLDELNHRVKNTLATVQSIAAQTMRSSPDMASAKKSFEARLQALSKAHNMLSKRKWSDTELGALVCQELAAYGERRIERNGPQVVLNPKASIALAMLIHELSANAAKFGALSGSEGKVVIAWSVADDGGLDFVWTETGGPKVSSPSHDGFGSRMIERVVTGELSGSYDCAYATEGFSCNFAIPATAYGHIDDAFTQG